MQEELCNVQYAGWTSDMGRPRWYLGAFIEDGTGQLLYDDIDYDDATCGILMFMQALVFAVLHFPVLINVTCRVLCPLIMLVT